MRRFAAACAAMLALAGATAASASAVTFSNPSVVTIPGTSLGEDAAPFPSDIAVGTLTGTVQKATVTLRGFSHACPNDLSVLVVGPSGASSILFSKPGAGSGCPPSVDADLTFDQAVVGSVPYPPVTGTYAPSIDEEPGAFSPPAPAGPFSADLGAFTGTPADGTWNLFVQDEGGGDEGSLSRGWSLTLTGPVPSNAFTVSTAQRNRKKGSALLPVTLPNPGTLGGSGKGAKISGTGAAAAGEANLAIRAKGKQKRKLLETGKVKLKVSITYTPTAGSPPTAGPAATQTLKVKLKKRP